jgi:hypothetical protein
LSLYKLNMDGKRKPRSEEDALRAWEERGRTEAPRRPRSEEDALREYEARRRAVSGLGEPAIPMEQRSKSYGSLSEFSKKQTGRRRRLSRKTRKQGRRGGRRT